MRMQWKSLIRPLELRILLIITALCGIATGTANAQKNPTRFDPERIRKVASMPADRVQAVTFSPDESLLVTASYDDQLRIFDVQTWEQRRVIAAGHGMPDCLQFSPLRDSRLLASAGNTSLKLWDFTTGKMLFDLKGHNSLIFAVAFSPDGKMLASTAQRTSNDSNVTAEIKLWDVATGRELATFGPTDGGGLNSIAFSPDGRLLAGGGRRAGNDEVPIGKVLLWNVADGKEVAVFETPPGEIQKVAFSPDGRSLAAASDQLVRGAMAVWDVATGRERFRAEGLPCAALDLAYSPDGRLLAVAIGDMRWRNLVAIIKARQAGGEGAENTFRSGDVNFYDANNGEMLGVLPHNVPLHRVIFAPRGKYLVTAGYDLDKDFTKSQTVAVWDLYPAD